MASEDSVDDVVQTSLTLLPVVIHGVREPDDFHQPLGGVVDFSLEEPDRSDVPGDVVSSSGEFEVPLQKRHDFFRNRAPRRDRVNEHVGVPGFRMDRSRLEEVLREFEKSPSIPMLIDEEFRVDVETARRRRMLLDGDAETAFSFEHTRQKPAPPLLGRQSFLLIACTHALSPPR